MNDQSPTTRRVPPFVLAVIPLVLLGVLVAWFIKFDPTEILRPDVPPIEELSFQRTILEPGLITLEEASKALGDRTLRPLSNDYHSAIKGLNYGRPLAAAAPRSVLQRELAELAAELSSRTPITPVTSFVSET